MLPAEGLQVPPAVASDKVVVAPTHIPVAPVIADMGLTVIFLVATQPAPSEYAIVVVPAPAPVTTPVVISTVATVADNELHVPPLTQRLSVIGLPWHTAGGGESAVGAVLTVTNIVATQPATV